MRILLFCLCFFPSLSFAFTVTDDDGHVLQFTKPAHRIISLAPDITEILFAIQANDTIVGVVSGSDYPKAALTLPKVGSYLGLDLERILALHPDAIITWGNNFSKQLSFLQKHGIAIYVTRPKQLTDVARTMQNLGRIVAHEVAANKAANAYQEKLQKLSNQYSQRKPVSVFYQIGDSLLTINKENWINQVITLCGGRNLFANATLATPEIDMEAVVKANPDVILSSNNNTLWQKRWLKWQNITAVHKQHLFTIDADLLERAGPRLLDGATQLCQYLQLSREKV